MAANRKEDLDMAVDADEVFKTTMTPEMIAESDKRADELRGEWATMRAELPSEVRERLDAARTRRLGGGDR